MTQLARLIVVLDDMIQAVTAQERGGLRRKPLLERTPQGAEIDVDQLLKEADSAYAGLVARNDRAAKRKAKRTKGREIVK